MVKVTIRRLKAGLTGASGLMLLQQADAGCAAPIDHERVGTSPAADTAIDPGTGTITISPYWTPSGTTHYSIATQGSVDEFVRVGERLSFELSAYQLWTTVHPNAAFPPEPAALRALQAAFQVAFVSKGDVVGRATPGIASWTGSDGWSMNATTDAFTVPATTDTIQIGLVVVDPADGTRVELADLDFDVIDVFGGEGSLKHVLFDNYGATLQERTIEGGSLVPNGTVMLTYTDWRADEIVDKTNLDRDIGTITNYGRFGTSTVPIFGAVQYEITAGYSYGTWWSEYPMPATTSSRVIPQAGRTSYETTLYVPQDGSTDLSLYFHVKAWLVVDYTPYLQNAGLTKKYAQGDRILLKDAWDNKDGKAFANYDVAVGP